MAYKTVSQPSRPAWKTKPRWPLLASLTCLLLAISLGVFFNEAMAALQAISIEKPVSLPVDI